MIKEYNLQYVEQLELDNGSIYTGYIDRKKNTPMGYGSVLWNDGSKYEGEWHEGKPNGKGKLILENGDTYEGDWKDDQACGDGCLITETKNYY